MGTVKYLFEIEILAENICNKSINDISNIKFKILYLTQQYGIVSPSLLISKIGIQKTNLALACKNLINENLITASKNAKDGRGTLYCCTPKGEKILENVYENLEKNIRNEEMTTDLKTAISTVLAFLNKKV